MDVAYYLSELLGQLGEVNVPGLGYFVQTRIPGYYNTADSTFYPPKNKVQFEPQPIDDDDDTLAQYIAEKKNISVASSRYFTEKYISNLKQEAVLKDVPLADLGHLRIQGSNIIFKAADVMTNDPAVFGYSPLRMDKLEGPSFKHQIGSYTQVTKEDTPEPASEPLKLPEADHSYELPPATDLTYEQVIQEAEAMLYKPEPIPDPVPPFEPGPYIPHLGETPKHDPHQPEPVNYQPEPEAYIPPINPDDQEEFVFHGKTYVPPERRSFKWLWITLLIILGIFVVGVMGMLALHKFRPALYNQIRGIAPEPVEMKVTPRTDSLKTDSLKKDTTKKASGVIVDTTKKTTTTTTPTTTPAQATTAPAIDSTKTRYEVVAVSAKTEKEAERYVNNFIGQGFTQAHIIKSTPGKSLLISLGTYAIHADADVARKTFLSSGKVPKDTYVDTINPKQ
jgi:hypothetical protein